ncbi:DUF2075 domain-containing protein [Pediococcus ethanolidurans]|uniref:DUF2075 domain-containing protein n=1 Tax=Pediococcus ethanolidurans TaxID=319653 RepID=UPI0021E7CC2C|nr:DUF2075 domain-containing protein [Pediococcus ethanolidurans]MCV3316245.1 DUF2075 domain-containing protein [Pediococcus ethanolidurans]
MSLKSPIIEEVKYDVDAIKTLKDNLKDDLGKQELLLEYPTDYVIYSKQDKEAKAYEVYVGETNNIGRRTLQHLNEDSKNREDWNELSKKSNVKMIVIGHEHFNKSLTLDIENRLMLYLGSVNAVKKLDNRRTNSQNKYYTSDEMNPLFSKVWRKLRQKNNELFPVERVIRDSAIFKASPFHSLTKEQDISRELIFEKVQKVIKEHKTGQLIFVEGEAGSGKTVLLSSLFYLLSTEAINNKRLNNYLLVNHDQQLKVYKQIATKLDLDSEVKDIVSKPTHFINTHKSSDPVDVVLVDEAHLLWTQGKQSYRGNNQLEDILKLAKVTIIIFDKHQILTTEEYWENSQINNLRKKAIQQENFIQLHNQMRMDASPATLHWIHDFVFSKKISMIPKDDRGYDLRVMKSPQELELAIKKHANERESIKNGLSRVLATFDWEYVDKKSPDEKSLGKNKYWNVKVGKWKMPWNLQLNQTKTEKRKNRELSWAEQPQTINEVGSTYTIQGFDLNYSGVVIGPSVKYRNGKVIFDPDASYNKKAVRNRTLSDGSKAKVGEELLPNELNVLLTRGVNGLYIYAVDPELQEKLLQSQVERDDL